MGHVSQLFDNDIELFNCITASARRSIPAVIFLREPENNDLVRTLKEAIEGHGIEAFSPEQDSGLNKAYKLGFLHASFQDPDTDETFYTFPTILHQR